MEGLHLSFQPCSEHMASVPLRGTKWCRDQPHGAGHVEGLGRFERSCGMFGDVDPVSCGMGVMVGCGMAWYCGWMDWDVKVVDGLCFFSVVLEHTSSQANTALATLVRHVLPGKAHLGMLMVTVSVIVVKPCVSAKNSLHVSPCHQFLEQLGMSKSFVWLLFSGLRQATPIHWHWRTACPS